MLRGAIPVQLFQRIASGTVRIVFSGPKRDGHRDQHIRIKVSQGVARLELHQQSGNASFYLVNNSVNFYIIHSYHIREESSMKVLKIIGIVIVVIIIVVLVLGLVAPNEFVAERKTVIDAPKELVYNQIKYWRNWQAWSPWAELDSAMVVEVKGVDGEVGAIYSWVGDPEKTGSGEMTNTGMKPYTEVQYELHFIEPYESVADGWMRLETVEENKTEAAWGFKGEMSFPMNIMLLFSSMDEMMQPSFDRGLELLKGISEKHYAEVSGYRVEEIDYPGKTFAAIRDVVSIPDLHGFFAQSYASITSEIGRNQARMTGIPCALYYEWDEQNNKTELAAAIPVNRVISSEVVQSIELPSRKAYTIDYYGPYAGSAGAHMALDLYLMQNGLEQIPPVIEEYVTDPQSEPDSTKWLTRIYYFGE